MNTGFHFEKDMLLFTMEPQDILVILPGLWLLQSAVKLIVWMLQVSRYSSIPTRGGDLCLAVFVENIPTLLLLAVYGLCRLGKGWRTKRQLDKTRIEDL